MRDQLYLCTMTVKSWIHLLLLCLCCHPKIQPAACQSLWMSAKFPCDVKASNTSKIFFDCRGRRLDAIPEGITDNVTDLDLSENFIKTIELHAFSGLLNLTWLNLNWANKNKKVTIKADLKNLTKLRELKLNGLCLKEIPQTIPVSVEILDLINNKITFLNNGGLAGLTNLTRLSFSRNCYFGNLCGKNMEIADNSFANLTKLQDLDLSLNNLSYVPKGLPQSLGMLNLTSNQIQHILKDDFSGLCHLKILKLQGNCPRCENSPHPCVPCPNGSLIIDTDAFENLTYLELLNLAGNSLEYLNPAWFRSLNNLKSLLLSENLLLQTVTQKAEFLRYLPKLEVIDFSFNYANKNYPETIRLSEEFSKLKSLKTLHMGGLVFQNIYSDTLKPLYELENLTALNLQTNFIIYSDPAVFSSFKHLNMIYLAENRLYPIPEKKTLKPRCGYPQRSDLSILSFMKPNPKMFTYELSHGLIKQECFESGRVISLSSNNLFFISPKQFQGFGDIACLNLSGNGFSAALNGTEFSSLPNLTYLDLSFNKIDLAYNGAFKELKKLEVLDLSHNPHYFQAFGITHNLNFIKNLPVLRVLNMSHNSISVLTTKQMQSKSLAELRFTHNSLGILWKHSDGSYKNLFTALTNLTILDISHNSIKKINANIYEHLPRNLTVLCISHNKLIEFLWDKLKYFHQLRSLDLSYNSLTYVAGDNSTISHSLTSLDLKHNNIFHLENNFFKGLKSLETLGLSYNKLNIINVTTFQSGPESKLKRLFLLKNPFQCTCDSLDFIVWIEKNRIMIPRLTTAVTCDTPAKDRDKPLIRFDIAQCVNDDQAFELHIVTSFFIITFMFVATITHLFYWDASYVLDYLIAKVKGYKSLHSADNIYDVFVTYDTKDPHVSEWVMRNLRVKLEEEGDKHHPLCLEERDWPLGVPLVDNLTQSIQNSRKTLFVLTRGYVKTGGFKLAMYLAHQRLLDENEDVIVLLLLEPVLQHSHFLSLRRRLCEKSVVEWPRTAAAEPWFWQNLRNILRVDNQFMYNKTYSKFFTSK
ncbi:toll-like receptor 8 [Kryptolebias marmoratus]|uniref:Toll like receptor 8 n=1 Tax=Kryptolebias marmoratus TaxID=37003 RepID=A0A3Q3GJD1_KRYMA|nr:toll-like receptor 8 [Kryptolebias marmoratus]